MDSLESNHTVLIIDSCFSGGIAAGSMALDQELSTRSNLSADGARLQTSDGFIQDLNQPKRVVLMASTASQSSWEFSGLEHGVFTYYILQAMSSNSTDVNRDGRVSAEEVFTYTANRVDSYAFPRTGEHQNPQISDGIIGDVLLPCRG